MNVSFPHCAVMVLLSAAMLAGCQNAGGPPATTPATQTLNPLPAETAPAHVTVVLPPIPGNAAATISPEMIDALKALSAEDYKTRQEALTKLQQMMGKHFQQMVLVQELMLKVQANLADQLKQMTLTPETDGQSKVASLMEFNNALSHWAIDVMALPDGKRQAMLNWGLTADHLPLIAKAYNRKEGVRASVAKDLGKIDGDEASWILCQLLNDSDREVSLLTLDALWDRSSTPDIVDALWNRATGAATAQFRQRQPRVRMINVRGRMIQVYDQDYNYNSRIQDADVAVDLLVKYKSPVIVEKLDALFTEMNTTLANNPQDYRWRILSPNYGEGGKAMSRLVETYKPKTVVPFLMKAVQNPSQDGYDTTVGNNEKARYSTRIDAAAVLLRVVGQDPEDYEIRKFANYGDRWMIKGGVAEENEMVKKIQTWWRANAKDYGVDLPPEKKVEGAENVPTTRETVFTAAPTTAPADDKAAAELTAKKDADKAAAKAARRIRLQVVPATQP